MELVPLLGNTWYCQIATACVGVYYLSPHSVVLIDSGTQESPEFLELLEARQLQVRGILHTHLHIDHIANDTPLIARYGAEVFAAEPEPSDAAFWGIPVPHPITTNQPDQPISIDGHSFGTLFTPGHSAGHQAILTPDGVLCLGDALMTLGRLKTAKIPFMRNVEESLVSLERIRDTDYPLYLAAHLGVIPQAQLAETLEANIQKELELYDLLRSLVTEPIPVSELERKFMEAAGLRSPRIMAMPFMQVSANTRIMELLHAGEFRMSGELILPNNVC